MKNHPRSALLTLSVGLICIFLISPRNSRAVQETPGKLHQDKEIIQGIEVLYNWEFDSAERLFLKVIADKPEDPIGYFYLAMVSWSRLASGFWSPETVQKYGERIDEAISVARNKIDRKEADSYTYFYFGGALGFKGRFQLMQSKFVSSFFLALEAIEALETCLRMDPNNRDVFFGLGIFDYYTARLSGVIRLFTYLLVHKGDKEEGLRKLSIAANEAVYSATEAKSVLVHIYLFMEEGRYHKALPLAQELADRFPKNPRFRYLLGAACIRLGLISKYNEVLEYLNNESRSSPSPEEAIMWKNRALYLEASNLFFHHQHSQAREKLDDILSRADTESDPSMIGWPILKKAMSYDIEGERNKAKAHYKEILEMENGAGAQFLAERFMTKRARKGDPFLYY